MDSLILISGFEFDYCATFDVLKSVKSFFFPFLGLDMMLSFFTAWIFIILSLLNLHGSFALGGLQRTLPGWVNRWRLLGATFFYGIHLHEVIRVVIGLDAGVPIADYKRLRMVGIWWRLTSAVIGGQTRQPCKLDVHTWILSWIMLWDGVMGRDRGIFTRAHGHQERLQLEFVRGLWAQQGIMKVNASIFMSALVKVSKHVIAGCLWRQFIRLIFRVSVQTIAEKVEIEVAKVGSTFFLITACSQLFLIQALQVVDCGDKVKVDLCKDITIIVLFDILEGELLQNRLLAVQVTYARLQEHVPQYWIFLILPCHFDLHLLTLLVLGDLIGQNLPV